MSSDSTATPGEKCTTTDANVPDLPFLVTHWLANYGKELTTTSSAPEAERRDALEKIHRVAAEISSAFTVLGAYGGSNRPFQHVLRSGSNISESDYALVADNATFADVARRWPRLAGNHLELMLRTSTAASTACLMTASNIHPPPIVGSATTQSVSLAGSLENGRRLGEGSDRQRDTKLQIATSALQPPTLISYQGVINSWENTVALDSTTGNLGGHRPFESERHRVSEYATNCTRRMLILRDQRMKEEEEMSQIVRSVNFQTKLLSDIQKEKSLAAIPHSQSDAETNAHFSAITRTASAIAVGHRSSKLDDIRNREAECNRVLSQLTLRQSALNKSREERDNYIVEATREAITSYRTANNVALDYVDPFQPACRAPLSSHLGSGTGIISEIILSREHGCWASFSKGAHGKCINRRSFLHKSTSAGRKEVLSRRLSHAITVNAHLAFPVYCLCFDRTGRYFLSGADDYLVKLFHLGATQSCHLKSREKGDQRLGNHNCAHPRGALLVSTLRGHAGVICDIDVNIDNALLATASDDGDCRVWGLKDGCPVAILRGHTGGANMVSWSSLSPYKLTTVGSDGLARLWDVREAALKRYGVQVGKRLDYAASIAEELREEHGSAVASETVNSQTRTPQIVELPPLPVREAQARDTSATAPDVGVTVEIGQPVSSDVQPLARALRVETNSRGAPQIQGGSVATSRQNGIEGAFAVNDSIDEGVKLIAKLQHGDVIPNHGPATRSTRKAVKIICISRCPMGGHFATGSDDGLARIWLDEDDRRLEMIDEKYGIRSCMGFAKQKVTGVRRMSMRGSRPYVGDANVPSTRGLLTTLSGHVNAITDLHYSHAGDRLLTASQKDGVVRIWSWDRTKNRTTASTSSSTYGANASMNQFSDLSQVLIQLTPPFPPSQGGESQSCRRRGGIGSSSSAGKTLCDVAVWTSDDLKIVTSQCCLSPPATNGIVPGSQLLLIWDSHNGHCLLGISEAHVESCSVLVPHPNEPAIICSAGGDGIVKIWDLEIRKCVTTYKNTIEYGPTEPSTEKGKKSGFLDGSFSPDGLSLVLTDDSGRVTIFDTQFPKSPRGPELDGPEWMREQYFANDYYELFYDSHGYCVERGSRMPPHLAPRAVRCSHSGTPFSDEIGSAFLDLVGPSPLPEQVCRWQRESNRSLTGSNSHILQVNDEHGRSLVMGKFNPSKTATINAATGQLCEAGWTGKKSNRHFPLSTNGAIRRASVPEGGGRPLSSNYSWRDYDDLLRDEDGIEDGGESDDEDFVEARRQVDDDDDSSQDSLRAALSDEERRITRRASGPSQRVQASSREVRLQRRRDQREQAAAREESMFERRMSTRQRQRESAPDPESDSDDDIIEYLGPTNSPSGPYKKDYFGFGGDHFYRMPERCDVNRGWLRRLESRTSFDGTKRYSPQVGDSVVYIPRAHYDTIREFPNLFAPWKEWASAWHAVRCTVLDIRYRFPYKMHFRRSNCTSVVAILALEVTGIPITQNGAFPWLKADFVSLSSRLEFEVSIFDGVVTEFVVPERLYLWRLKTLHAAVEGKRDASRGKDDPLEIVVYLDPENAQNDDPLAIQYKASIVAIKDEPVENEGKLSGSGFECLEVRFRNDEGSTVRMSPWEITLTSCIRQSPEPPCIDEEAKSKVSKIVQTLTEADDAQYFLDPVDVSKYTDYLSKVEIPMDIGFICSRLETDYYTNVGSLVSDVKLIWVNCAKYNGEDSLITESAKNLLDLFQARIEQLGMSILVQGRPMSSSDARVQGSAGGQNCGTTGFEAGANRGTRRSSRLANGVATSSLERLPAPSTTRRSVARAPVQASTVATTRVRYRSNANGEKAVKPPVARTNNLARQGLSPRSVENEDEEEFDPDDESNDDSDSVSTPSTSSQSDDDESLSEVEKPVAQRRSSRVRRSHKHGPEKASYSSMAKEDNMRKRETKVSHRRSSRLLTPPKRRSQVSHFPSDDDDDDLRSETDEPHRMSPRLRRRPKQRIRISYSEVGSDDPEIEERSVDDEVFDAVPENLSSCEDEGWKRRSVRLTNSRCPLSAAGSSANSNKRTPTRKRGDRTPKRKARKKRKTRHEAIETILPELKPWPTIDIKKITAVAKVVLSRMRVLDAESIFSQPVVEEFPEDAGAYLQEINEPMDFRTIEEEKIPRYAQISELQDDLILVFRNCIAYNKVGSTYGEYARTLWEGLNEVFRDVCKEVDVLIPRRW